MATLTESLNELGCGETALARALEEVPLPAYVFDRGGVMRWTNSSTADLFGDLVGRSYAPRVAPEYLHVARREFARKLIDGSRTEYDLVVFDREGGRVPIHIRSAPLRASAEIVGVFGVAVPRPEVPPAPARGATGGPALTARQHEVLRLLSEGKGTPEIAAGLGVSEETARNHVRGLLRELGAHSRLEAVVLAQRLGLLGPAN